MIIIGIDPGTARMGYGVIEVKGGVSKALNYGLIETSKDMVMPMRLKKIYDALTGIIAKSGASEFAIEQLFFNTNVTTAITVGQARGVAILAAANAGLEIFDYTPLQVKMALTGYGRADKNQVQQMVKLLLTLKAIPKPDDTADALAIALCHAGSRKLNKLKNAKKE
ncbi:MAG: crossover junction endodeoxyribonuclease RuvC [bacterium]